MYSLRPNPINAEPLDPAELAVTRAAAGVSAMLCALLPERAGVVLVGPGASGIELGDRLRCGGSRTAPSAAGPPRKRSVS